MQVHRNTPSERIDCIVLARAPPPAIYKCHSFTSNAMLYFGAGLYSDFFCWLSRCRSFSRAVGVDVFTFTQSGPHQHRIPQAIHAAQHEVDAILAVADAHGAQGMRQINQAVNSSSLTLLHPQSALQNKNARKHALRGRPSLPNDSFVEGLPMVFENQFCSYVCTVARKFNEDNTLIADLQRQVFVLSVPALRQFAHNQLDKRLCIDTTFNVCDNSSLYLTTVLMLSVTTGKFFAPYFGMTARYFSFDIKYCRSHR